MGLNSLAHLWEEGLEHRSLQRRASVRLWAVGVAVGISVVVVEVETTSQQSCSHFLSIGQFCFAGQRVFEKKTVRVCGFRQ